MTWSIFPGCTRWARDAVLTVSPFYHFNRAHYTGDYVGAARPRPAVSRGRPGLELLGRRGFIWLSITGKHNARVGLQVLGRADNQLFGVVTSDGSNPPLSQREMVWGNVEALFLEDQYRLTSWLTINGGVRLTHFGSPSAKMRSIPASARRIRVPRLNWVLRGFYGRYYQAPPLLTVNGPLLEQAAQQVSVSCRCAASATSSTNLV